MLTLPNPKTKNDAVYEHALKEIDRLWDEDHAGSEFIYLLDWIIAYEDAHYPMSDPKVPYLDEGQLFFDGFVPNETTEKVPFRLDVTQLVDFSSIDDIEDFSYSMVVNGYIDNESGEKYFPARTMGFIRLLTRALENRLLDYIESESGEKDG